MRRPVVKFLLLTLLRRTNHQDVNLGLAKVTVKVTTETTCRQHALEAAAAKEKKTKTKTVRVGRVFALPLHPFIPI